MQSRGIGAPNAHRLRRLHPTSRARANAARILPASRGTGLETRERVDTPRCHDDLVERIAPLATRAPRYTSYPPATVFGALPDGAIAGELATLARERQPASLYVHVPFC